MFELEKVVPFFASSANTRLSNSQLIIQNGSISLIFYKTQEGDFPNWVLLNSGLGVRCGLQAQPPDTATLMKHVQQLGVPSQDLFPSNSGVAIKKPHSMLVMKLEYEEDQPDTHFFHGYILRGLLPLVQ